MTTRADQLEAALRLGREMRQAQRRYFRTRDRTELMEAQRLEREFDRECFKLLGSEVGS